MHNDYHLLGEAYQQVFENVYLPGPQSFGGKKKTGEKGEEECGKGCTCGECEHCTPEYVEKHLGNAEDEEKKPKGKSQQFHDGAVSVIHSILGPKVEDEEDLAKQVEAHLRKIHPDYDPKKAARAIKAITGSKAKKSEDDEWDDEERRGDANGRWSDKRTGRSHRDDQGPDDE